jgi:hypothetical protein
MPFEYRIDKDLGVVFFAALDPITDDELIASVTAVNADPLFDPEMRLLADYSAVTLGNISSRSMQECGRINRFSRNARAAIVLKNVFQYGMYRMFSTYSSLSDNPVPQGFMSRAEAVAHLNEGLAPEKQIR